MHAATSMIFLIHIKKKKQEQYEVSRNEPSVGVDTVLDSPGLSLRAGGQGFSPPSKRVAPGYFYWKVEEK